MNLRPLLAVLLAVLVVVSCNRSSSSRSGGSSPSVSGSGGDGGGLEPNQPVLVLERNEGGAGVTVELEGAGFAGSCRVKVFLDGEDGVELADASVEEGSFSVAITIPDDVSEGEHAVVVKGFAAGEADLCDLPSGEEEATLFFVVFSQTDLGPYEYRVYLKTRLVVPDLTVDGPDGEFVEEIKNAEAEVTHAIVQLKCLPRSFRRVTVDGVLRAVAADDVADLASRGVELLEYLNGVEGIGTSYVAAVSREVQNDDALFSDLVRAVLPLEPLDRLDPALLTGDPLPGSADVLIRLFSDVPLEDAIALLDANGVDAMLRSPPSLWEATLSMEQLDTLAGEDAVQWIEPGPTPFLPLVSDSRAASGVDAVQALNPETGRYAGLSGAGLRVAILDDGVDRTHLDLAGRVLLQQTPESDHGTAVAGVVAGSGLQSDGVDDAGEPNGGAPFEYRGVAPEAGIVAHRPGAGVAEIYDEIINGLGVDVINHSYVLDVHGKYSADAAAVDAIARGGVLDIPGRPMVWAVGNNAGLRESDCGDGVLLPQYPLDCDGAFQAGFFSVLSPAKNPIAVGSVDRESLTHSAFSSLGPTLDGRLKPELTAVGSDVLTVGASVDAEGNPVPGNGYRVQEGSSLAAPVVTGAAALLLEAWAETFDVNINIDAPLPSTVKAVLVHTATDLVGAESTENPDTGSGVAYGAGPDWATGYGLVNAEAAVALVENRGLVEGEVSLEKTTEQYLVPVPPGQNELKITLAWDDVAGSPTSSEVAAKLVNDLDLTVIEPDGTVHRPLVLPVVRPVDCDDDPDNGIQAGFCDGFDAAEQNYFGPAMEQADRLNNLEQVHVVSPEGLAPGNWKVRVSVMGRDGLCVRLPLGGSQKYSLAGVSTQRADVRVEKTAEPAVAVAGEGLFYTIRVTNDGPDTATDVAVVDTLPAGVRYVTDTGDCVEEPTGTLTCQLGDLDSGESREVTVKVVVDPDVVARGAGAARLTNRAEAFSSTPDDTSDNNVVVLHTIVDELADLRVSKICKPDRPLLAGETGTCTILVDNLGPSTARNVRLTDTVLSDGGYEIETVTPSQGSCGDLDDGVLVCDLGDIEAASTTTPGRATVTIELTATAEQDISDRAEAVSDTPDPDTSNNVSEDSITVEAAADLALSMAVSPNPVTAGTPVEYTLSLINEGPSEAVNVEIEDNLPAGLEIESVDGGEGGACRAGVPGDPTRPTVCSFGALESGASVEVTIVARVLPDVQGILHNDARATSETIDSNNSNNLATVSTSVVGSADLSVSVEDITEPFVAGTQVTYEIMVANNGPSTARRVLLRETLPDEFLFQEASLSRNEGRCVLLGVSPKTVSCEVGDLDPGEIARIHITVLVDPSTPEGVTLMPMTSTASDTDDPNPGNEVLQHAVDIAAVADLRMAVSARTVIGNPSNTFAFTVSVANFGPSDAQDVVLVDTLPLSPDTKTVEYIFDTGNCTIDSRNVLTCHVGTLAAGAQSSFDVFIQVKGNKGEMTNTATASSSTPDPDPSSNTASASILVDGSAARGKN